MLSLLAEKRCFKCARTQPLTEFYAHPGMADGHLGKCRTCTRLDARDNYARRRPHYQAYDRARNTRPERLALRRRYRIQNPEKIRAHQLLNEALRIGAVRRQPCEVCGSRRVDAHHDDYAQPLTVRWLCRRDHTRVHHPF